MILLHPFTRIIKRVNLSEKKDPLQNHSLLLLSAPCEEGMNDDVCFALIARSSHFCRRLSVCCITLVRYSFVTHVHAL